MHFSNKQIWTIAFPVLFSLLMEHLIGMTDTAYLGRVGEVELGASALAGVYYLAIFMLGFGFSVGAQILIARRNGERRYERIGAVFQQGVAFLLLLAAVMFTVSRTWSPVVLRSVIESDDVYRATVLYLDWRVYGFFFAFVGIMFRAFFVGITRTRILVINSVVMVLVNVVLNYILIFGKLGLPAMGIVGAAIASSIAELSSMIFFVIYTWAKVDWRKYGLFNLRGFNFRLLPRILNISVWTMIQQFLAMGVWFLFFVAVEHLGERPLAITNIVRNVSALPFIFVIAFATTCSSLVGNLMGAGEQRSVMKLVGRVMKQCYLGMIPLLVLLAVFPSAVLRIYTDNAELIAESIPSMWVMLGACLVHVPGFILFNAVSGTGNTRSALVLEMGSLAIYAAYIFYIAGYLRADVAVCWTAEWVYGGGLLAISYLYLRLARWQDKRI